MTDDLRQRAAALRAELATFIESSAGKGMAADAARARWEAERLLITDLLQAIIAAEQPRREIALMEALELALSALPDSETAGPDGAGYHYLWDACDGDEQEWVKSIRARIRALASTETRP